MGAYNEKAAAHAWRQAQAYNQASAAQGFAQDRVHPEYARRHAEERRIASGDIKARLSGLGVQIDAMIQRLKDDGHSAHNIARVLRLRADKLEAAE